MLCQHPEMEEEKDLHTYQCPVCRETIAEGEEDAGWHILRGNRRGHEHTGNDGIDYVVVAHML